MIANSLGYVNWTRVNSTATPLPARHLYLCIITVQITMPHNMAQNEIGRPAFNRAFTNAVTTPTEQPKAKSPTVMAPQNRVQTGAATVHVKRLTLTSKKNWWMGECGRDVVMSVPFLMIMKSKSRWTRRKTIIPVIPSTHQRRTVSIQYTTTYTTNSIPNPT